VSGTKPVYRPARARTVLTLPACQVDGYHSEPGGLKNDGSFLPAAVDLLSDEGDGQFGGLQHCSRASSQRGAELARRCFAATAACNAPHKHSHLELSASLSLPDL